MAKTARGILTVYISDDYIDSVLQQLRELLPEEKYIDLKGVDYMLGFNDCRRKILEVLK
jgi:hypothetical protein